MSCKCIIRQRDTIKIKPSLDQNLTVAKLSFPTKPVALATERAPASTPSTSRGDPGIGCRTTCSSATLPESVALSTSPHSSSMPRCVKAHRRGAWGGVAGVSGVAERVARRKGALLLFAARRDTDRQRLTLTGVCVCVYVCVCVCVCLGFRVYIYIYIHTGNKVPV